jgi:hypothetical protein
VIDDEDDGNDDDEVDDDDVNLHEIKLTSFYHMCKVLTVFLFDNWTGGGGKLGVVYFSVLNSLG